MTRSRALSALATIALFVGLLATVAPAPVAAGHPDRISGADRYQTAAKVSASRFAAGVPVAYVVTGAKFPDALAAGVAAGVERGPVLLTQPTALPPATVAELDRLRPAEIVVVGGTGSVSDGVLAQLRGKTSGEVTRVQGPDRVGGEVDVGTHPAELGGALVHDGVETLLAQGQCEREPADAATDDRDPHVHSCRRRTSMSGRHLAN